MELMLLAEDTRRPFRLCRRGNILVSPMSAGAWAYQSKRVVEVQIGEKTIHVEQNIDGTLEEVADGTNRRMWPTAPVLARFLAQHPESIRGKRVCEVPCACGTRAPLAVWSRSAHRKVRVYRTLICAQLGSGSGAVGMACAALGAQHVVITDVEEALPLCRDNVQRNAELLAGRCDVLPCRWGDVGQIEALLAANDGRAFDVVIACEVVYKQCEEVLLALASTQEQLTKPGGVTLLAYEYRGEFFDDMVYFDAANERFECTPLSLRPYEGELLDAEYGEEDGRWLYTYTHKQAGTTARDV